MHGQVSTSSLLMMFFVIFNASLAILHLSSWLEGFSCEKPQQYAAVPGNGQIWFGGGK